MEKKSKESVIKELFEIAINSGLRTSEILSLSMNHYNDLKKYYVNDRGEKHKSKTN